MKHENQVRKTNRSKLVDSDQLELAKDEEIRI
jgi:hypothetical protein